MLGCPAEPVLLWRSVGIIDQFDSENEDSPS